MKSLKILSVGLLGSMLAGCTVEPAAPPPQRVVEHDVVDSNGVVVDRYYVEDAPPPAQVEVVGVAPYPGAIWVHGYYARGYHHRYVWVRGYWR